MSLSDVLKQQGKAIFPESFVEGLIDLINQNAAAAGASYKVYTAFLTQTGVTDNPTADVLENTLGGEVVWTRQMAGSYKGTLMGAFPYYKTLVSPFCQYNGSTSNMVPVGDLHTSIVGYYNMYNMGNENDIVIETVNGSFEGTDIFDIMALSAIFVEIRVYP